MSGSHEWNWDGVSNEAVREIVRLAEVQLSDLLAVSLAADQRATAQAAILAGFAAALLAGAATLATGDAPNFQAAWSLGVAGVGMVVAAFLSGLAAKPIDYYASGAEPRRVLPAATNEIWMLKGVAERMQQSIEINRSVLARTAKLTAAGYNGALVTIVFSAGLFLTLALL